MVPGVASFSAAAAAAGTPLVRRDDVLTILPGTLPPEVLAARLRSSDAAVVHQARAHVPGRVGGGASGRASSTGRSTSSARAARPSASRRWPRPATRCPYMSLVLVPGVERTAPANGRRRLRERRRARPGRRRDWLTPEAHAELAAADELVGYETYLARVPERARSGPPRDRQPRRGRARPPRARAGGRRRARRGRLLRRPGHLRDGRRGARGRRRRRRRFADVELRIVPGLSAMQAAAARVGAPLGHDFCVISLSDELKPWDVVERRLDAAGAADLVLALYNPASRTRREQLDARDRGAAPPSRRRTTPVVVARAVGAPEESVSVTTLGGARPRRGRHAHAADRRLVDDAHDRRPGRRAVYTPRRYPA